MQGRQKDVPCRSIQQNLGVGIPVHPGAPVFHLSDQCRKIVKEQCRISCIVLLVNQKIDSQNLFPHGGYVIRFWMK